MACLSKQIEQIIIFDPLKQNGFIETSIVNFSDKVTDKMKVKISNDCKLIFFSNGNENFIVERF